MESNSPTSTALHRYLELVMLRANAANDYVADAVDIGARLAVCDEDALRAWAGGFAACVAGNKRAWPTRILNADDKRMLKNIAAAARHGVSRDLTLVLPAWISSRHAAGRCGFELGLWKPDRAETRHLIQALAGGGGHRTRRRRSASRLRRREIVRHGARPGAARW